MKIKKEKRMVVVSDYLRGLDCLTSRPPSNDDPGDNCRHLGCRPVEDMPRLVMKHGLQRVFRMAVVKDLLKNGVKVFWERGIVVMTSDGQIIDTSHAFFWRNLIFEHQENKNQRVYNLMNARAYLEMSREDESLLLKHNTRTEF